MNANKIPRNRSWIILPLVLMSLVAIGLGVWLCFRGQALLGCFWIGAWLYAAQRYSIWLIAPGTAPRESRPAFVSMTQRLLFGSVTFGAAAVSAIGVYLCYWWPEEWQAGFVFVLLGLIVLLPVSVTEVRFRKTGGSYHG